MDPPPQMSIKHPVFPETESKVQDEKNKQKNNNNNKKPEQIIRGLTFKYKTGEKMC